MLIRIHYVGLVYGPIRSAKKIESDETAFHAGWWEDLSGAPVCVPAVAVIPVLVSHNAINSGVWCAYQAPDHTLLQLTITRQSELHLDPVCCLVTCVTPNHNRANIYIPSVHSEVENNFTLPRPALKSYKVVDHLMYKPFFSFKSADHK